MGWSQRAATYSADVPERALADRLAVQLAARGHRLVAVRGSGPKRRRLRLVGSPETTWHVTSLLDAPWPEEHTDWWQAHENRAVAALVDQAAGTLHYTDYEDASSAERTFNRTGVVHELRPDQVAAARRAALADLPLPAPAPYPTYAYPALHDRPGPPIDLAGVDDVDWDQLEHAYGPAGDVAHMLTDLAANDDQWPERFTDLVVSVLHQGSLYTATAPTLDLLTELALSPDLSWTRRLHVLHALHQGASAADEARTYGIDPDEAARAAAAAVDRRVPDLVAACTHWGEPEQRVTLFIAAATGNAAGRALRYGPDGACALAAAMLHGPVEGERVLAQLASADPLLLKLVDGPAPLQSRLVAALSVLALGT